MPDNTTLHPSATTTAFSDIEDIIADVRDGKMVIMVDDENRENEGDLICLTLTRERCAQLRLPLMVVDTDERHATNFTVSIEAAEGITTGISAHDRAKTVLAAVAPDAKPEHLRQPGHIFPVMAQPGGVLTRAGHTEAGCDLARLAGLEPAATIVEILNEDGSMARRPDLERFARDHNIRIGMYCYDDQVGRTVHVALVKGDVSGDAEPLVRVHILDTLGDALGIEGPGLGWPVSSAIERISHEESGIVILLRDQESARDLMDAVDGLGIAPDELEEKRSGDAVLRTYGVGAQILKDLSVKRMRVLSAPKQMYAISGFDLEISEYVER